MNNKIIRRMLHISFLSFILSGCASIQTENIYQSDLKHTYDTNQFLNYREVGNGSKTLVMLHGFAASNRTWDDVIPYFDKSEFRLILIDLIGSGFSSIPKNADFSMAANADTVIDLIHKKQLKDYVLVGHSFGGGVVLNTALKIKNSHTAPPAGLVLMDAAAYNTGIPFFVKHLRTPVLGRLLLTLTPASFRAKYTLKQIYFDKSKVTPDKVNRYAFFSKIPGSNDMLLASAQQIIPSNYQSLIEQYKNINTDTLIIWGLHDNALSIEGGKRLAAEMPAAQLKVIEKSGHNPQEEQPEEVAALIKEFVATLSINK